MKVMVKDLGVNEVFISFFLLESFELRRTRKGREFLVLRLSDRSGRIVGFVWDRPGLLWDSLKNGVFVKVMAMSRLLNGSLVLDIWRLRRAEAKEVEVGDFFEVVPGGISFWFERLIASVGMIEEEHCRRLVGAFLRDEGFLESFKLSPAALSYHHRYLGGLLEHTVMTMRQGVITSERFGGILDRDLLLTGCFLHDIGKTREMDWGGRGYRVEGRLLGHIGLGLLMLEEKLSELEEFPGGLGLCLKHMILSHHGGPHKGSPLRPLTPEAIVLHLIEGADAALNHLYTHVRDSDLSKEWTPYDRFFKTEIYLKRAG